ncbi:MAG: ferrochelatase [Arcobacteraceae bacterium]|nr:ferrochelatase [Arcobacteraceae bacterium]
MKALVLLNMGGARSKEELKIFLHNMFNDKNILTMKSKKLRSIIASFIVSSRLDEAWKNYEAIGGESPLHKLTDNLVVKLQKELDGEYFVTTAMRYTEPFSSEALDKIKEKNIKDIVLLPLYPQYSTTTTKSSLEDFIELAQSNFNITIIEPFFKNELFNDAICDEIIKARENQDDYYLIFSAHGLPQKIIKKGDPYQSQIEEHVEILKTKLSKMGVKFEGIHLAYQSKVGPMKWIEPSLDYMLTHFKDKKVIIYPIAFIIDNSETVFELDIEYRELSEEFGLKEYKVCRCVNDNDTFIEAIKQMVR